MNKRYLKSGSEDIDTKRVGDDTVEADENETFKESRLCWKIFTGEEFFKSLQSNALILTDP